MQRRKLLAVMGPILFGLSRFRTGTSASSTGESSLSTLLPPEIEPSNGLIPPSTGGSGSMPTTFSSMEIESPVYSASYPPRVLAYGYPTGMPLLVTAKPQAHYSIESDSFAPALAGSGSTE